MNRVPFIAPVDYNDIDVSKKIIDKVSLIDADRYKHLVVYRMWQKLMGEGQTHSTQLLNSVIDEYLTTDIFSCFEAKAYVFCFSAPSGQVYRNAVAQSKKYKGNRGQSEDKYFYTNKYEDMAYVYEYINKRYETLLYNDLEADDLLSMLQSEDTFIFSHDKDLKQVPGWHWDMDNYKLIHITEEDGLKTLLYQMLTGDPTDNIRGLDGFGPKSLEKLEEEIGYDAEAETLLFKSLKLFLNKYGILNGIDSFVEMYNLVSMKINRGQYLQEKYCVAFAKVKKLCQTQSNLQT